MFLIGLFDFCSVFKVCLDMGFVLYVSEEEEEEEEDLEFFDSVIECNLMLCWGVMLLIGGFG